ncbi:hypothetical protein XFF6990_320063 [Xanthomonas citri pv. fuscans]|nr:hypothetical protein XFF6990_320063 [Xanthomonas citri pv. fuscans]
MMQQAAAGLRFVHGRHAGLRQPVDDGQRRTLDPGNDMAHPSILVKSAPSLAGQSQLDQDSFEVCILVLLIVRACSRARNQICVTFTRWSWCISPEASARRRRG